jgi:cytochrome c oxidase assembly factor CtaG
MNPQAATDRADQTMAPARRRAGRVGVALLIVVHVVDQVLRGDASGWPFTPALTWFTASLLLYPALLAGLGLLGGRPWTPVALAALLLVAAQVPHMGFEIDDNYDHRPELLATLARRL